MPEYKLMPEACQNASEVITYKIVRSSRKSMGLEVGMDGSVIVRIPRWVSVSQAREFAAEKHAWIIKSRERMQLRREKMDKACWEKKKKELFPWIDTEGRKLLLNKIDFWAQKMGVSFNRVSVRDTASRWGSCSSKKNLSFSWKIFLMPEKVADYLIIHELSHLLQMNHSPAFWEIVGNYCPDYKKLKKKLDNYE